MRRDRSIAAIALVAVAALTVGGLWRLAATITRTEAAALVFVLAAVLFAGVVGVRSRRWASSPYF